MPPTRTAAARTSGSVSPGLWGFLMIVPALFLLGAGARAWWAASRYPSPTIVTLAEFNRKQPREGWYTVTDCVVNVADSVYWEQNGVCVDVYAPVRPASAPEAQSGNLYVEIDSSPTLSTLQDLTYARKNGGAPGAQRFIAQHRDVFLQRRDVSGLVSVGKRDPMGEWQKAGLDAANSTFIADGWRPNPLLAYGGTAVGGLWTVLSIWLLVAGSRRARP